MGGRRLAVVAIAAVLMLAAIGAGVALLRGSGQKAEGEARSGASAALGEDAGTSVTGAPPLPTPAAAQRPASGDAGASNAGGGEGTVSGEPSRPDGSGGGGGAPPSPPPQPPPSRPAQPSPVPCSVFVSAGPMPGVPNIRIVVMAAPNVDMLWATVTEGNRAIRGAIALAGGRGEQIVDGLSQGARVAVFSDASMADPTLSCSSGLE